MAKCVGQGRVPSGGRTRLARSDVLEGLGDERRVGDGGDDAHLGTATQGHCLRSMAKTRLSRCIQVIDARGRGVGWGGGRVCARGRLMLQA